jgi:nickel-dependent lactate racemase
MDLPLGTGRVSVGLPDCDVTIAEPPGGTAVDPREAAEAAVADPHGPPLADRVDLGDEVAVVVTDVTRAAPDDALLDALLTELRDGGVAREDVTVVIGLGLHRPMDDAEIREALGDHADLAENHDASAAVEVGTVDGCPVELNPVVAEADRVVSTGMVEPHQYAGFSGGAKTAVIGAGGEPIIRYTHGPEMLARDGVRLGRVEGNPFRDAINRAGDVVDLDFCLNVTHGPAGSLASEASEASEGGIRPSSGVFDASAGDHRDVVRDLAASAHDALSVPVDDSYDAVIAGVGAPKDANLYQTTRAATYVALGDRDPLREGGRIVIPAQLPEGAGRGTGERRFYERLSEAESADALYEEMREGYDPGAQRAFVVAQVLREYDVYVTNSEAPDVVEECLMHARPSVDDAVEPGSDVLVVPDALNTLLVRP